MGIVAPLAGAWIEICCAKENIIFGHLSLPLAGAWIEMAVVIMRPTGTDCRSPRGSVD